MINVFFCNGMGVVMRPYSHKMNKLMTKSLLSLPFLFLWSLCIGYCDEIYASDIEFNTSLLDVKDKESIDSGVFKQAGYIVPGIYTMQVSVNGNVVGERKVEFVTAEDNSSSLCFTSELVKELSLKPSLLSEILTAGENESGCYSMTLLSGLVTKGDIGKDTLMISIPQHYRIYATESWDPPARWENGISGLLLDYGANLQYSKTENGDNNTSLSTYGVAGINVAPWRFRADWQARYEQDNQSSYTRTERESKISRVYGYRALPDITAKLSLGELDMGSSIFDGFRFFGAMVETDDNMLPPNLRGYAPEIVGIAKTNAKVVVMQQGRVLYETQVAAGPFRIQDLNSGITGLLDVRVEETDGSEQTFQVNTANIPYLSRPGSVRYKMHSGRVLLEQHDASGPAFLSSEFSWGIDNGWSLLGGALLSDKYSALSFGIGRDLLQFGAISFDMTESRAKLNEEIKRGGSYRVNYSKNFIQYDSQVSFAGYRFSERNFMNMSEFVNATHHGLRYEGGVKEMYNLVLSKQFREAKLGSYIDYTHQSYWNQLDRERISLSLSRYFDVMDWQGITASLTAYHNEQGGNSDDGVYFSLAVPLSAKQYVSYNASNMGGGRNSITYSNQQDENNNYSVTASKSSFGEGVSGFYTHNGDINTLTASVSHEANGISSVGLSIVGGGTLTPEGGALHRITTMGGARILVDTDKVSDIPLQSGGFTTYSNRYGKAVVADITGYYRQRTSIDVDKMGDNAEPLGSPIMAGTLTEGAIGYRHFGIISGAKRMVIIKKPDGHPLPLATEIKNAKQQQIGILADEGVGYLSGLHDGDVVTAFWGDQRCKVTLPPVLPDSDDIMMLSCH